MNTTGATTIAAQDYITLDGETEGITRATTLTFESDIETRVMIDADNDSTDEVAAWYRNGIYDATGWLAHLHADRQISGSGEPSSRGPTKIWHRACPCRNRCDQAQLVSFDPYRPGEVRPTTMAGDHMVLGVASDRPGILFWRSAGLGGRTRIQLG